jgi:4-amino-4-deoxy-L-arabinose transferase-like glycosyltransferase
VLLRFRLLLQGLEQAKTSVNAIFRGNRATPLTLTTVQLLVAIALLSFTLRALCAIFFRTMIDTEGAEYGTLARNLLAGAGYVGIATPGEQLFFPPLFPFLIAAVSSLTGDVEIAGRIVSVVFGSLVIVPVYFIAQWMYGERTAIAASVLTGLHPYLVQFSTTVFCETTYLTVVLMAVYMALRAIDAPTPRTLSTAGALYGLAYLVRPEALAYMLVSAGFIGLRIALRQGPDRAAKFARLPLMLLGFLVFAGPYIAWLSVQTGELRVQGKSALNLATEVRIQQGQTGTEAAFGVDPDLTLRGVWLHPSLETIKAHSIPTRDLAALLVKRAKAVIEDMSTVVAGSLEFGSPALFALATLGLFARPWPMRLAIGQTHTAVILALVPVGLLFTYVLGARFYILFLPFLCIWAVFGIARLAQWAQRTAAMSGLSRAQRPRVAAAVRAIAVAAILLPSTIFAAKELRRASAERPFKEAIIRLAAGRSAPMRIADGATNAAFHARADFVWLPYSDEATALRFLAERGVTHVVVRYWLRDTPYLTKWFEQGVPGSRLIIDLALANGDAVKVYQFDR